MFLANVNISIKIRHDFPVPPGDYDVSLFNANEHHYKKSPLTPIHWHVLAIMAIFGIILALLHQVCAIYYFITDFCNLLQNT